MRRRKLLRILLLAAIVALMIPGAATADHADDTGTNTCEPVYSNLRQGRRTGNDDTVEATLWPPNHKFRTIAIAAFNEDEDPCDVTITDARQDEAIDAPGSGNKTPDAASCHNEGDTSTIDLRGERAGWGDGRFYHVTFEMDDPNSDDNATHTARMLVPHDQSPKKTWTDDGPVFPSYDGLALACTDDPEEPPAE